MKLTPIVLSLVLPLFVACSGEGHDHPHPHDDGTPEVTAPAPTADAQVHAVECGCTVEGVGKCSEYIQVDGEMVPLKLPVDMGSMPFCGKSGLHARCDGEMVDGVFVASTFAYEQ